MNARLAHITVMLMLTAPTPKDHSIVPVILDTLEMESRVLVSSFIERFSHVKTNILDCKSVIVLKNNVMINYYFKRRSSIT